MAWIEWTFHAGGCAGVGVPPDGWANCADGHLVLDHDVVRGAAVEHVVAGATRPTALCRGPGGCLIGGRWCGQAPSRLAMISRAAAMSRSASAGVIVLPRGASTVRVN